MDILDCIIIGTGPAGISAALELKKKTTSFVMIEKSTPGGKVNIAPRVDNYPPYTKISGPDLAFDLFSKVMKENINVIYDEVTSIKKEKDVFKVSCSSIELLAKTIIVASGTVNKKIGLENEDRFFGHGLSYCAICDGHFYKDKISVVIGEEKFAVNEAIYLADICKEVIFITSFSHVVGDLRDVQELDTKNNVTYIYNSKVTKLVGESVLEGIMINEYRLVKCDGLFPLLGHIPNSSFLDGKLLSKEGFLQTNKELETKEKGMFGAGDILTHNIKQIFLADLEGKKAASKVIERLGL